MSVGGQEGKAIQGVSTIIPSPSDPAGLSHVRLAIADTIITLFRNVTGRTNPTINEKQIIEDSVQEAVHQITTEPGIGPLRFTRNDVTVSTVPGQSYIDLPEGALTIVSGTVRIPEQGTPLFIASTEWIHSIDPKGDLTGMPVAYAINNSGNPDIIRLTLYPTPGAVYQIALQAENLFDVDDNFPVWITGPLTDLATAIAMRRLSFGMPTTYEYAYEQGLRRIKDKQGYDGPLYIDRHTGYRQSDLQRRANA